MAMTDVPEAEESQSSRSRSPSPLWQQSSSEHASPTPSTTNGVVNDAFHIPHYNFPPNLVPRIPGRSRRQTSASNHHYETCADHNTHRPGEPGFPNTSSHHVTETHHITKDYDERTGAKTINRYEFHDTIGKGVHGKVKLAKDIETGNLVAIKIMNRLTRKRLGRWDPMEVEQKIRREIAIMKKCIHPHVVALREVMDDPNSQKIYLGTEFMA
jgi:hypothetical protein